MSTSNLGSQKSLLEEFGIPIPETLNSCNLVGLEYGENISAVLVWWDECRGEARFSGLPLSENGTLVKRPNTCYISPNMERLVYDTGETESDDENEGRRYHNFVKCIGTVEAAGKYIRDDGTSDNLTYKEIMAKGFNIAINTILKSDVVHWINPNKPTIILVGCPSGEGWEERKIEYANLLKSQLKLPEEFTQPVYVAICGESDAVLARETDSQWGTSRVEKGESIVILDNGANTFDIAAAVVGETTKNGGDSYQFGGNLLDRYLFEVMQRHFREEYPDAELASSHRHKWGIRIAKEKYYENDVMRQAAPIYMVNIRDRTDARGRCLKFRFEINEDVMDEVLEKIPVTAFHDTLATGGIGGKEALRCDSWLDGCRQIYQSFYEEMKCHFKTRGKDAAHPVVPDHVILSGGVSRMPEVQQVAEEVFGVKPVMSVHSDYAVSEGLACVLFREVRKGQYLQNILAEIQKPLSAAGAFQDVMIKTGCEEDGRRLNSLLKKQCKEL